MILITRKFEFDAGHRIVGHESKCKFLHGHRYVAEITFQAPKLDALGRVRDFGELKKEIGSWIDDNLDHNMILFNQDPILNFGDADILRICGRSPFIVPFNPTAENLSKFLFEESQRIVSEIWHEPLVVEAVKLFETPNCWAIATRPKPNPDQK